jgi:DNA polymerase-3 subunit alpha
VVLAEAAAMGVEVLPPDVNEGQAFFWPSAKAETHAIRFGLAAIKGVGEVAVHTIIAARQSGGSFTSLEDLCTRVDTRTMNRKVLEALIKCGACDCLGETRASMFARIDRALARGSSIAADKARGQGSLFGMLEESPPPVTERSEGALPEWPQHELLAAEKELLGFYVTGHPLTPYAPILEKYLLHDSMSAKELEGRAMTRTGGMISAVQQGFSKKSGKPYAMVTLEDLKGSMSLLCLNENYDKFHELLTTGTAVGVVGEVNNEEDRPKIFPQEIFPLAEAPRRFTDQVHLRLFTAHLTAERLEAVRELVSGHRGKCPLFLCLRMPGGEAVFIETHQNFTVTPSLELQKAADEMFGEETYYVKVDSTLPERQKRWGRRNGNGNGGE